MLGTELLKGQGLGNQLFCYVTTRCIALKNGYDFSILAEEAFKNDPDNVYSLYFMNLDMGMPSKTEDYASHYWEKEDRLFIGNSRHDMERGAYLSGVDEKLLNIPDNTLIYGNMQAEQYFVSFIPEIKKWLKVKEEYDSLQFSRDNLCILNMRGGEYTGSPELYLKRKYWTDAMKNMQKIKSNMEFMIVTEDVQAANKILPEIKAYHFELAKDYVTIKNAKYLIASNSSFACFPIFTSDTLRCVIAPKYWARHNVSNGYWASEQNIYEGFTYQDKKGRLFTAAQCREELEKYKHSSGTYKKLNKKPGRLIQYFQKKRYHMIIHIDLCRRIPSAIKRRLKG